MTPTGGPTTPPPTATASPTTQPPRPGGCPASTFLIPLRVDQRVGSIAHVCVSVVPATAVNNDEGACPAGSFGPVVINQARALLFACVTIQPR